MSIQICDDEDGVCFLYCSTTMRPVNLESFENADAAQSFLTFAKARGINDVRRFNAAALNQLHVEWLALPQCDDCGGHYDGECTECADLYESPLMRVLR